MHKNIDFTQAGGLYVYQDTLAYLQSTYSEAIAGIAAMFGDKVIVSGCEVNGSTVAAGWLAISGELLPLAASTLADKISIVETPSNEQFNDGTEKSVYKSRIAQMGNVGDYNWSDFVRAIPYKNLWLTGDVKEVDCTAAYITANFDATGLGIGERKGWAVCNGNNGTRDRGGRVPVGYSWITSDPNDNVWDAIYRTIGGTGGEKMHQLGIEEMASHDHYFVGTDKNWGAAAAYGVQRISKMSGDGADGNDNETWLFKTSKVGGGQSHENRQPFIVTLFIQKI